METMIAIQIDLAASHAFFSSMMRNAHVQMAMTAETRSTAADLPHPLHRLKISTPLPSSACSGRRGARLHPATGVMTQHLQPGTQTGRTARLPCMHLPALGPHLVSPC